MGVLGDKLAAAIQEQKDREEAAKQDVNNFIWKGPKREIAGMRVQSEVKLMEATPEQLQDFYKHCISMLYSTDKQNPGRYVLKDIVKDQINKCNAELCLRWLENKYMHDDKRHTFCGQSTQERICGTRLADNRTDRGSDPRPLLRARGHDPLGPHEGPVHGRRREAPLRPHGRNRHA